MIVIINILSIILEQIILTIVDHNSLFIPLFSLLSLIIVYPYIDKKINLLYIGGVIGLVYDVAFTQTPFLNTIIYCVLAFLIIFYYKRVTYRLLNTMILSLICIILFRLSTYIFYIIFTDESFSFYELVKSIYSSIIINILYIVVQYYLFKNKLKIRKRISNYTYTYK